MSSHSLPSHLNTEPVSTSGVTVNAAAEDLGSEANGAVGVPGLGVDADVTGDGGNGEERQHRHLWVLVPFKDLFNSMGDI